MTLQPVVYVPLGEVSDVVRGVTFRKSDATNYLVPDHTPVLRAGNIGKDLDLDNSLVWVPSHLVSPDQRIQRGDIVMCTSSGSSTVVGKSAPLQQEWNGTVGAFCVLIRTKSASCDPDFLAFFLISRGFRQWAKRSPGVNIKNIRKGDLEQFEIPLPPLAEQRRIVNILNRAAKIERLRKQAQERVREFIPALFVKMFGDPVENPMGWEKVPLGDICTINPRALQTNYSDDMVVSFVPMAAIDEHSGEIVSSKYRTFASVSKSYTSFEDGDILFAKITPCMENGKAALAQNLINGIGRGSTEFHVLRPGNRVLGEYVFCFVRLAAFRENAKKNFTGTAGQQRVPKSFIEKTLVPLPPLYKQNQFAKIIQAAQTTTKLTDSSHKTTMALTASLMSRLLEQVND